MKDPGNIREIARLSPEYMGFIYHPPSKRYAGDLSAADISDMPSRIRKVGVFVDLPAEDLLFTCRQMGIRTIQLHGNESPEYCRLMKDRGLEVFKVLRMDEGTRFDVLRDYLDSCELFLLDTAGEGFGGTGKRFNWQKLEEYRLDKPFFLSGGIGPSDAVDILKLDHSSLFGLDLNSRFESKPGIKNFGMLEEFIHKIRHE